MGKPRLSYIIASTMRTGSYLLCEALEWTAVAGHPREIFCPERRDEYEGEWKLPHGMEMQAYVRASLEKGMTPNGVFGTKIHYHHLAPLARECSFKGEPAQVLHQVFPGAKYVHLRRRDRRGQAISWYRAKITNEWWRIKGVEDLLVTGLVPEFHAQVIRRHEFELERQQRGWERFFAQGSMEFITMDYEDLAGNYREEVGRVLAFIGEDAALAKELPEPRLIVQADAMTEEWRARMDAAFPLSPS